MNEKRRGGSGLAGTPSHVLRTTAMANSSSSSSPAASSASPASSSSTAPSSSSSSSSNNNRNSTIIIAPPPRAALQGPSTVSNTANADDGTGSNKTSGRSTPINSLRYNTDGGSSNTGGGINNNNSSNSHSNHGVGGGGSNSNNNNIISTITSRAEAAAQAAAAQATLAASAAHAQLIKEKDMKIHALERELATMEAEFGRELDKLSQNESEAAAFWQAKHSSLNQQFLRADTELRLLRNEVELREAERGELGAEWEGMRRELARRDEEVRELRGQVRGLKDWVSTSTRNAGGGMVLSDEVFAERFARLGNGLQNWVIVNFRRARLDLSRASEPIREELRSLVPMAEELAHASKLHMLQSLVSRLLVEMVFDCYFVGLTEEQAAQFVQTELLLTSFAGGAGGMEAVNQWRSATLAILSREAPQRMKDETARLTEQVVARVNRLLDAVTVSAADSSLPTSSTSASSTTTTTAAATKSTTPTPSPAEARDNALRQLVSSAVDLSRLLVVQRASFIVLMPEVAPPTPRRGGGGERAVAFDRDTMEDVGDRDEDSLVDAEVRCVTFPGVIKRGDESGGGLMQYENVICKCKVLCSSGPD